MRLTNWLILDLATAPVPDAATYLDGTVRAPSNYKDEDKIKAYIAEKEGERVAMAATDIDLARVIGIGALGQHISPVVVGTYRDEDVEARQLESIGSSLDECRIVTFGGLNFDLPLLMRRARYLGVDFPTINLDRYKSSHIDLMNVLSDRDPRRMRSLDFYCKRLGYTDLCPKPLTGAEEAQVPVTGKWDELADSLRRDVTVIYRIACWLDLIQPVQVMSPEQVEVGL